MTLLVANGGLAYAGGLYVTGFGPAAQAQAGAYVATADDAMAVFTNPAGLATQRGTTLQVGSSLIDYSLAFTRRGAYDEVAGQTLPWEGRAYATMRNTTTPEVGLGSWQAVPMFAVASDLLLPSRRLVLGLAMAAPAAYPGRNMGDDYVIDDPNTPPPPNRYDTVAQDAAVILPSIAVGYRVTNALRLGARFSWGYGEISSTLYAWTMPTPNYQEWIGNEATIAVAGKDNFVPQVAFGAHYRVSPHVEVAAMWQSRAQLNARGEAQATLSKDLKIIGITPEIVPVADAAARCAPGGTREALKTCIDFALPMTAEVGGRYIWRSARGQERGSLEADVRWEAWSRASDFEVVVDAQALGIALQDVAVRHGFVDVWSLRLGGNVRVPVGRSHLGLRGGIARDTAAARPGWERVDIDGAARTSVAGGFTWQLAGVQLELGAGYIFEGTRDVGGACNPTLGDPGCRDGAQTAWGQRSQPDPVNPLRPSVEQFESPFNSGRYVSHYVLAMAGVSARF
ncbi:MAG: outer membrane protein transport protein [Myxococcales bacterium]|nr:outer membrane protein transport protein [Myxococcales bacterium]